MKKIYITIITLLIVILSSMGQVYGASITSTSSNTVNSAEATQDGELTDKEKKELEKVSEDNKDLISTLKDALKDKDQDVKMSSRLKTHPVCLVSSEGVSFEMEKVLNQMPDGQNIKAGRILEINPNHAIFTALQSLFEKDKDKINDYASLLYDQALLIEGFSIDDPVEFSNKVCQLMVDANK